MGKEMNQSNHGIVGIFSFIFFFNCFCLANGHALVKGMLCFFFSVCLRACLESWSINNSYQTGYGSTRGDCDLVKQAN